MKFDIDRRSIPAIVFFIAAMGLLVASVRTTTLAEKAVEDARSGLIPAEKAQNAPDFTLPAVTVGSKSTPSVNLHNAAAEEPVVFSFWASYCCLFFFSVVVVVLLCVVFGGRCFFF